MIGKGSSAVLLLNSDHFGAVWSDGEFEFAREFAEVFLTPEVAHEMFAGEFQVGPVGGDGGVGFAEVEEADSFCAVFEVFGENAEVAVF